MDLNKLNFINQEEHQKVPAKNPKAASKNKRHVRRTPNHAKSASDMTLTTHANKYSNIRLAQPVADRLQAMQNVTGDSSRSALIDRMLNIVDPVILNNTSKKRKYRHDLHLIRKKAKILMEFKRKM